MEAELYSELPQGLYINSDAKGFLSTAARWGRFLAIVGFIVAGFIGLAGLFMSAVFWGGMGNTPGAGFLNSAIAGIGVGLFYSFCALLYLFPMLYLYKFSSQMQAALISNSEEAVSKSFKNLKSLFKFIGVLTIVVLVVYLLGAVFMPLGAFMGAFL